MNHLKIRAGNKSLIIDYDAEAHTAYIRLRNARVAKTIEKSPHFFLDISRSGELIGIEILDPQKLSTGTYRTFLKQVARQYKSSAVRRLHPEFVPQVFAA